MTYRVAANTTTSARSAAITVADVSGQSAAVLYQISQAASTGLSLRGAYVFMLQVDPTCGWPVTKFYWPVTIQITSYAQGITLGSIVFPPAVPANTWTISAGPTGTQLVPGQGGPGPAGGAYDVVVDGGRWEAGGLTRAYDGRGEITSGTASGARLMLTLRDSGQQWECRSDATWSLRARWTDTD